MNLSCKFKICLIKTIGIIIGFLFYKGRYLKGKHFKGVNGWKWVIRDFFFQKILDVNRDVPFPVDFRMSVIKWENIDFDNDSLNLFQKVGNYYQASDARIHIGRGTEIADGVAIITTNHDLQNISVHSAGRDIYIGEDCWIAAHAVILPGVNLGNHTVVAAGAVVTKSFEEGWCVVGGVPAKKIKDIVRK